MDLRHGARSGGKGGSEFIDGVIFQRMAGLNQASGKTGEEVVGPLAADGVAITQTAVHLQDLQVFSRQGAS